MSSQQSNTVAKEAQRSSHAKQSSHGEQKKQQPKGQNGSSKAREPVKTEKWIVVIKNVENDFGRVHAKAVERFCCLNPSASMSQQHHEQPKRKTSPNGNAEEESVAPSSSTVASTSTVAKYRVTPRTETRSAEILVYAPTVDADISDLWVLPTRNETTKATTVNTETDVDQPDAAVAKVQSPFSSVGDMISVLRLKPYFTHPPVFVENSEVMVGEKSFSSKKRSRDEDTDTAVATHQSEGTDEGEEEEAEVSGPKVLVGGPQSDFVTVHIVSSAATNVRNLKKVLSNGIPGFVTCWWLRPLHFRAVFVNESALFHAKKLLDQFDAEGLKLNLLLPDSAARRYEAYLAQDNEA
mmetsp:Transcript_53773/g.61768  ORF Transcript_53773/g.61768 Transcript_53773/m.61768 type:complete len:352 (+) Transcript_53773:49-1104(+)